MGCFWSPFARLQKGLSNAAHVAPVGAQCVHGLQLGVCVPRNGANTEARREHQFSALMVALQRAGYRAAPGQACMQQLGSQPSMEQACGGRPNLARCIFGLHRCREVEGDGVAVAAALAQLYTAHANADPVRVDGVARLMPGNSLHVGGATAPGAGLPRPHAAQVGGVRRAVYVHWWHRRQIRLFPQSRQRTTWQCAPAAERRMNARLRCARVHWPQRPASAAPGRPGSPPGWGVCFRIASSCPPPIKRHRAPRQHGAARCNPGRQ